MARCIAFDKPTAQAISRNLHLLTICDPEADPVQAALRSHAHTSLLALPAEGGKRVLVATFQRCQSFPQSAIPSDEPLGFEATGFLGLSDEPIYAQEAGRPKKWWQKIL